MTGSVKIGITVHKIQLPYYIYGRDDMVAGERGSVASLMWLIAFTALAMAAVFSPADAGGVVSLVVGGHLLWGLAFILAGRGGVRSEAVVHGQRFVVCGFAVAGAAEMLSLLAAGWMRVDPLAIWLVIGLTFMVIGVANTRRCPPHDGVFASQIFFHMVMVLPGLAVMKPGVWPSFEPMFTLFVLTAVLIPFLFVALLIVVAYDLARPRRERALIWSVLLVDQAAFLFMAMRWWANRLTI
jgi:hypothetical protein